MEADRSGSHIARRIFGEVRFGDRKREGAGAEEPGITLDDGVAVRRKIFNSAFGTQRDHHNSMHMRFFADQKTWLWTDGLADSIQSNSGLIAAIFHEKIGYM